jgi:hypothetical protein
VHRIRPGWRRPASHAPARPCPTQPLPCRPPVDGVHAPSAWRPLPSPGQARCKLAHKIDPSIAR